MKTPTNAAATLLNLLALLTVVAGSTDREEAEEIANFFWSASPGTHHHQPDGRVLRHW